MSKTNVKSRSGLRLLALVPVTLALIFAIACTSVEEDTTEADLGLDKIENATFEVNGKTVTKAYVDRLDPENIQTVNIVKEGDEDKVKIVTRGLVKLKEKISYEDAKKLFVVDGEVQAENFDISSIGKENIKTVNIIGDKNEIKKYSDEDYDGVVVITTK